MPSLNTLPLAEPASAIPTAVYLGRLMSPRDVSHAIGDRSLDERKRIGNRWFLCGDVGESSFAHFKASSATAPMVAHVDSFASSAGGHYVVVTHEAHRHQHRFVLPLYDASIGTFFGALAEGADYAFSLGRDLQGDALVLLNLAMVDVARSVLQLRTEPEASLVPTLIRELPDVVNAFTHPKAIPLVGASTRGEMEGLSVSVVLPNSSIDRLSAKMFDGKLRL